MYSFLSSSFFFSLLIVVALLATTGCLLTGFATTDVLLAFFLSVELLLGDIVLCELKPVVYLLLCDMSLSLVSPILVGDLDEPLDLMGFGDFKLSSFVFPFSGDLGIFGLF